MCAGTTVLQLRKSTQMRKGKAVLERSAPKPHVVASLRILRGCKLLWLGYLKRQARGRMLSLQTSGVGNRTVLQLDLGSTKLNSPR